MLGMSLCGVSNYGSDIGGFAGSSPEPELLVRWVQNGIFHPRFSIHSVNYDVTVTVPWLYTEYTDISRNALNLRYRMMPYMYSLMYQAHVSGQSMLQPLCSVFQQDTICYDEAECFMLGDALFIANILEKGQTVKSIYLPIGSDFYDFNTRMKYEGGQTIEIPVSLDSIPMYLTSGAILPMTDTICHNLSEDIAKDLHLICVADCDNKFVLYEDDGKTLEYKDGMYRKTIVDMSVCNNISISFTTEGKYESNYKQIHLDVVYPKNAPFAVSVNGQMIPQILYKKKFDSVATGWHYNPSTKSVEIKYENPVEDYKVEIYTDATDLIGM